MILVIFGAGASYDSVPALPPDDYGDLESRPPLAEDLFLNRGLFAKALSRFPQCHPIVPYLRKPSEGKTIEQILEGLQTEAEEDPVRKRQLVAVRYYLHFMIWECENAWIQKAGNITNYLTLLDQLRRACDGEPVCIVTFNYDRMIENALALAGIPIRELSEYISHDVFKLFKLHGSIHWGQVVRTQLGNISNVRPWRIVEMLIERASDIIETTEQFRIVSEHPIATLHNAPLFPAIAIPVQTKKSFVCPNDHLECLKALLPETKKMLIIGWSGTEYHFLDLLKQSFINRAVRTLVVAESEDAAGGTLRRIQDAGVNILGERAGEGFSDFVVSRRAEKFLA